LARFFVARVRASEASKRKHEEIGKTVGLGKNGEIGLFADEGASGEGKAASAKSSQD